MQAEIYLSFCISLFFYWIPFWTPPLTCICYIYSVSQLLFFRCSNGFGLANTMYCFKSGKKSILLTLNNIVDIKKCQISLGTLSSTQLGHCTPHSDSYRSFRPSAKHRNILNAIDNKGDPLFLSDWSNISTINHIKPFLFSQLKLNPTKLLHEITLPKWSAVFYLCKHANATCLFTFVSVSLNLREQYCYFQISLIHAYKTSLFPFLFFFPGSNS